MTVWEIETRYVKHITRIKTGLCATAPPVTPSCPSCLPWWHTLSARNYHSCSSSRNILRPVATMVSSDACLSSVSPPAYTCLSCYHVAISPPLVSYPAFHFPSLVHVSTVSPTFLPSSHSVYFHYHSPTLAPHHRLRHRHIPMLGYVNLPLRGPVSCTYASVHAYNSFQLLKSMRLSTTHRLPGSNGITYVIASMSPNLITCIRNPSTLSSTRTIPSSPHGLADPRRLSSIITATSRILTISPRTLKSPSSLAPIRPSSSPMVPRFGARSCRRTHTKSALGMLLRPKPRFPVHRTLWSISLFP